MPYSGACPAGSCDHGTVVAGIAAGTSASFSGIAKDATLIVIPVVVGSSPIDHPSFKGLQRCEPFYLSKWN